MNRVISKLFPLQRLAGIFAGLLLVVSGSFYFFGVSAQTEIVEKPAEQNLTSGKIAFVRYWSGMYTQQKHIYLANPDGSEETRLPSFTQFSIEPAWSPDGTKLIFVTSENATPGQRDIYVMPADSSSPFVNLTNTADANEGNPDWSVNGKIAYERNSQIWTMNADGSGQAHFSAITQPSPMNPAWSPDGTKLAFTSGGSISLINADGTNQQRLTTSGNSLGLSWSPDGSKIAFRKGGTGIAVVNSDGSNEINLTNGFDMQPSWSPDGTRIAFRRSSGDAGIYVMNANGENQIRILADQILFPTPCCDTHYEHPVWQPIAQTPNTFTISGRVTYSNLPVGGATVNLSGTTRASVVTDSVGNYQFSNLPAGGNYIVSPSFPKHYFTPPNRSYNNLNSNQTANFEVLSVCQNGRCAKNGKIAYAHGGEIYTINPDGGGLTNITNNSVSDGEPNYSPDGSNIIFSSNRDGNVDIYRMDSGGNNPVRLTNNDAVDYSPYYSLDGASIVFVSNRDGNYEIYKMNADGSNQVRLTNNAVGDYYPAFSPDSRKIVYYSEQKLYTMNADGSNQQQIPDSSNPFQRYERSSFSNDGSKILFSYNPGGTNFTTTYTMNLDGTNRVQVAPGRAGTYSPDGTKLAYVCCYFNTLSNPPKIRTSDVNGSSERILPTPSSYESYPDNPDWQALPVTRPTFFDFDGDGRTDISVFRPSNGAWYMIRSTAGLWVPVWGLSTDVLAPADYDGDLKTDVAVWRGSEGKYYILNSFDGTVRIENFGLPGDIPTGGDWDGDGKADLAVYRAGSQSIFYYRGSMGNPQGYITSVPWGISGDKPVVGDYDGDGRTDAAVYRNGDWYVYRSSNGQLLSVGFGIAGDKAVPADYDGDGKADFAVFRDGVWYQLRSTQGFAAFQFGVSNDVPTPADYDGDGRADAAVYRDGIWWMLNSQTSTVQAISLGISSDKPIPSVFIR